MNFKINWIIAQLETVNCKGSEIFLGVIRYF